MSTDNNVLKTQPWYDDPSHWRYKIQRRAARVSRNLIKSPFYIGWLEFNLERDDEVRAGSVLQTCERADFLAVTTVEYYTPSTIGNLFKGLANLRESRGYARDDRLGDVIRGNRGSVGSSVEIYLYPEDDKSFTSIGHITKLPDFASSARVTIINLSPSLTALAVTMYIKDKVRCELNDKIHMTYPVRLRNTRRNGVETLSSRIQQRNAVRNFRKKLRDSTEHWFQITAPGTFSKNTIQRPYLFFVSTGKIIPIQRRYNHYCILEPLELYSSFNYFQSIDAPSKFNVDGLFFSHDSLFHSGSDYHLCGSESAFLRARRDGYGSGLQGAARTIDAEIRHSLAVYWLVDLLYFFSSEATPIRDDLKSISSHWLPTIALARLQRDTALAFEGVIIASEIKTYINSPISSYFEIKAYMVSPESVGTRKMRDVWIKRLLNQCERNIEEFKYLSDLTFTQASLTSARHSFNLNFAVLFLSITTLALTFRKEIYLTASPLIQWALSFVGNLYSAVISMPA